MRNSEVYAYIERLYDALHSGLPDGDVIDETLGVVMDFEDEVNKAMLAESKKKSGFDSTSTSFFNDLAASSYDEIIEVGKRMDEVHPEFGEFMEYLMHCDDPTFLVAYGDERVKSIGYCSGEWLYLTCQKLLSPNFPKLKRG